MKTALIVGDHPVTHIGCGQLLRDLGYDEVFEALTDREAYRLAEAHRPDLIVLDPGMPGVGGLNMIGPLAARAPDARILIFTMNEQTVFAVKALEGGAGGYLSKNSAPEDFLEAVRTLERGEMYLSHKVAVSIASMKIGGKADPNLGADRTRVSGAAADRAGRGFAVDRGCAVHQLQDRGEHQFHAETQAGRAQHHGTGAAGHRDRAVLMRLWAIRGSLPTE